MIYMQIIADMYGVQTEELEEKMRLILAEKFNVAAKDTIKISSAAQKHRYLESLKTQPTPSPSKDESEEKKPVSSPEDIAEYDEFVNEAAGSDLSDLE